MRYTIVATVMTIPALLLAQSLVEHFVVINYDHVSERRWEQTRRATAKPPHEFTEPMATAHESWMRYNDVSCIADTKSKCLESIP